MHLPIATGLRNDRGLLADRIRDAPWLRRRQPYLRHGDGPYRGPVTLRSLGGSGARHLWPHHFA